MWRCLFLKWPADDLGQPEIYVLPLVRYVRGLLRFFVILKIRHSRHKILAQALYGQVHGRPLAIACLGYYHSKTMLEIHHQIYGLGLA